MPQGTTTGVALPVATSTFTTVAAFIPLLFWPGIVGDFMKYLPITLIATMLSSLFVAYGISPVEGSKFINNRKEIAKAKEAEYATVPPVTMTREAAINYGARVMDPLTSVRLADGTSPSATVYVGERLVLRASAPEGTADAFSTLDAVAKDLGVTLHRVSTYPRPETDLVTSGPAADIIAKHWVDGVQIVPDADKAAYPSTRGRSCVLSKTAPRRRRATLLSITS